VSKVDTFLSIVQSEIGKPYVYGDAGPTAFDCSGLVTYGLAQVGISLPHNAAQQQKDTTKVTNPQPGDLVFFGQPAYHVGIYIGGGKMISAPHTGASVHIVSVGTPTGYGRVPGLGTGTAALADTASTTLAAAGSGVSAWLGTARYAVIEALAVALGLGLVALGGWKFVSPALQRGTEAIEGVLP
jgi:hypothetical protein